MNLFEMRQDNMGIPNGWCFDTADFSLGYQGWVLLKRDKQNLEKWHGLSEELREKIPLYISGEGNTFFMALKSANIQASKYLGIDYESALDYIYENESLD